MTIITTTIEDVQDTNGRAIRLMDGDPNRAMSFTDDDGHFVTIVAYDVPEAAETELVAKYIRHFGPSAGRRTEDGTVVGRVTEDDTYAAALAYAESLCVSLGLPLINESTPTFRRIK